MSLESCTQAIRTKVGADSGLDATLKFDMGDDGVIVIDGKSTPNTVSNTSVDTDCTVDGTVGLTVRRNSYRAGGKLRNVTWEPEPDRVQPMPSHGCAA